VKQHKKELIKQKSKNLNYIKKLNVMYSYYKIRSDSEKVEQLFEENDIEYDFIEEDDILDYDEVKLNEADEDDLFYELKKRRLKYDQMIGYLFEYYPEKEIRKDIIRYALKLNNIANVDDVIEEVKKLFF